mgnify:CR=1 FL=1
MADKTVKKAVDAPAPGTDDFSFPGQATDPLWKANLEVDTDPFSFLDEAPPVEVSRTPQQLSEDVDRQLWFQKKAELENIAPGTPIPEEWERDYNYSELVTVGSDAASAFFVESPFRAYDFTTPDPKKPLGKTRIRVYPKRDALVQEHYQEIQRHRDEDRFKRRLDYTGTAGLEEGGGRKLPSPADVQPKYDTPLKAHLSFADWRDQQTDPALIDVQGELTKKGIKGYASYQRQDYLQRGVLTEEVENQLQITYAAAMKAHFDLSESEVEQLLNGTAGNSLNFEAKAEFVEATLFLKKGAFGKQNESDRRKQEQFFLFNKAKREALDRGDFAFASLFHFHPDEEKQFYYVATGQHDMVGLGNRNEAIAAAYEAIEAGVLDPGDLWRIERALEPSGMGTSSIAQSTQNILLRQDLVELTTAQGKELYTPRSESVDKLLFDIIRPGREKKDALFEDPPETLNESLEFDNLIHNDQFLGIQKLLLLQHLKRYGRDEEFEALDKAVLDAELIKKYIPDQLTHKFGLRRLRQMFRELAANHANSAGTFKFFDSPSEFHNNIRVTPMGTVLIAPELQYRKDWFEAALAQYRTKGEESLSDKQIRLLRQQRTHFMSIRFKAIDRVLEETTEGTSEAWFFAKAENDRLPKETKKSNVELLDEFLQDPENYAAMSSQTGAILDSIWDVAILGTFHSFAALMGSESSVQTLIELGEDAADRREIAKLFGEQYGLSMEVMTALAPILFDITATALLTATTGAGGGAFLLTKHGVKAGARGHLKILMTRMLAQEAGELPAAAVLRLKATGLIRNSADAATSEGLLKAIKAYNNVVVSKLGNISATSLVAINRSAAGSYTSIYSTLKKQNPDKSHEWLHDQTLGPALAGGALTALLLIGMQGIGKGGMENALIAKVPWKKAKGILNSISKVGIINLTDDVAKRAFVKIMKKKILKQLGSKIPQIFKDMGHEGFEEALDTFLNSFIEDWATGESRSIAERIRNSWDAFKIGALTTSTLPVARWGVQKIRGGPGLTDPAIFKDHEIQDISRKLAKTSPQSADVFAEILSRPVGQPEIREGEVQLEELPEARVPRVPKDQREEHLKEVAEVLKGQEPIEGEGPFLDDLPQIDDPDLLELAEKDTNYNVNSDGVVLGVRNIKNGEWVGQEPDEDAPTISRPDVPEGTDPNDLRYPSTDLTGDTVTEETVKAEAARWADVNKKQLENKGIKLIPTDLNKGNPTGTYAAVVNIESSNKKGVPVIQVDFAGLARRLDGVDKKDRYKVFNAILGEELTHAAEIIQFKLDYKKSHDGKDPTSDQLKAYVNTRYEAMYADMQVQERRNVVAAYENINSDEVILPEEATADRKAQMTKAQIAGEFTRMLLQYESTKTTTESAQWLTSDEVSTFLGGVSERISKNLLHKKTGFQGPVRHNLRKHLDRVNSVLADFIVRRAELDGVDPDIATAAAKEEQLIQEVQFDGHHEDGTSFSRDWGHIGNSSKRWTSRGKDRDGATRVHRDRNYKIVRNVVDVSDVTKDTYELINLETQQSEGVFEGPFEGPKAAEAKHKELTSKPDTSFDDPDIEPPKPVATTAEDQTYLDLIENQSISENAEEIQKKVFQAALNPTQIAAVEAHAKAVDSGELDAIQEARRQMGSVGLGDIPAEAIKNISDPVKALSAVLESFGLDPEPIITDEAGTTLTLSERFPNETQIIPLNPESANTTDLNDELRVIENARVVRDVASQWGIEVIFNAGSTVNRGDVWADGEKVFVDTNTIHESIKDLSDKDANKLMAAKALAQVSVALSFQKEHSQAQITALSKETSTKELYNLADEFYPDESSRAEAKKRLEGAEGDTQAGQEISFLIRQKIANDTSRILQGQTVSSLEADIRNRPTFKRQVINFMGRVYTRLVSAKRRHKNNPNLSISISNLAESMKTFRGMPRGPRRERFNPEEPNKQLDSVSDMLDAQAPMSDESKVDTSGFKIEKEALTHVANSDSRFAPIAQELIDSFGDDLLGYEQFGLPEEASPSQILRTFLKNQLSLAGQLPEENGIDPNLKGEELHVALTKMVTDARASDDPKVSKNPELDLWEVYLSLVDPKQMTRNWKSQHSFFGFLDRMLSDPWVQSNARQDTVGFTNSWDKFTKAATTLLDFKARGGFQKADVLDIIDSSLEEVDFAPQEDPPIGFQPLGTSNANRSTLAKLEAEFGDDPRRHLQQLHDAVSRSELDWESAWGDRGIKPGTKAYSVIEDRMQDGVASLYEAYKKVYEFFGNPVDDNLNKSIELARKEPKFNEEVARLASMNVSDTDIRGAAFSVGHSAFKAFILDGSISATEFWEQFVVQQTWSYEAIFSKETFQELMELRDLRLDPLDPRPLFDFHAEGRLPQLSSNIQRIALESKDKDRRQLAWNTLRARRWLSGEDQIEDFTPLGTSNAERTSIEVRLTKEFGENPFSKVYSSMVASNVIQRDLRKLYQQAARDASDENLRKVSEKEKQFVQAQTAWGKTVIKLFKSFSDESAPWALKDLRDALTTIIWENEEYIDYAPQLAEKIWTDAAAGLPAGTDPQVSIPISEIKRVIAETPASIGTENEFAESALLPYLAMPDAPVIVIKRSQVAEDETMGLVFGRWIAWKAMADAASWAKGPRALAAADLKSVLEDFRLGKLQYPARALNLSGDDPADAGLKHIAIKLYKVMKFLSGDGISEDPYMNLIGIGWDKLRLIESRLANDLGATAPPREHIGNLLDGVVKHSEQWFEVAELVSDEVPTSGPEATVELTKEADMALAAISSAREAILKAHAHFGNSTKEIISDMKAVIAGASDGIQRAYKKQIELVDGFFGEESIFMDPALDPEGVATEELGKILERLGLGFQAFKDRVATANFANDPLDIAGFTARLGDTEADKATFRKLKLLASFTSTANFFRRPYSGVTFERYFDRLQSATRVRAGDFEPESLTHLRVWERLGMGALSPLELGYPTQELPGVFNAHGTPLSVLDGTFEDYRSSRQTILTEQSWLREALQSDDPNIRQRAINYLNAFDYLLGPTAQAPDIDLRASGASRRGVDLLKAKVEAGDEITIAHIGDTGSLGDQERKGQLGSSAPSVIGVSKGDLYSNVKHIPINLTKGQDFLKGAGRGSDILVLHRIPDEGTAAEIKRTGIENYSGKDPEILSLSDEAHTVYNWKRAIAESGADLVYLFFKADRGDFNGLDFVAMGGPPAGYELVGELLDQYVDGDFQTVLQKIPDIDLRASGASRNRFGVALPHTTRPFDKFIGGLTVAADGTLPKEPLRAQVAKRSGWSREEREMVNAFIDLSPGDRVNVTELVKAVELRGSELLETKTRIVKDKVSPEEFDPELADVMHPNRLKHELETLDNSLVTQNLKRKIWVKPPLNTPPDSERAFALNDVNDDSNISSLHQVVREEENWEDSDPDTIHFPGEPLGPTAIKSGSPDTNPLLEGSPFFKEGSLERFLNGFPFRVRQVEHSMGFSADVSSKEYSEAIKEARIRPRLVPWGGELTRDPHGPIGFRVVIDIPHILQEAVLSPETQQLVGEIARGRGASDDKISRALGQQHTAGTYTQEELATSALYLLARSLVPKLQYEGVSMHLPGTGRLDEFVFWFPIGFTPEQLQADLLTLGVRPEVARLFSEFNGSFPKVADKWEEYGVATKPTISEEVESVNPKLPKDMEDFGHSLLYAPEGGMKDQGYFEEAGYKANQLMGWTRHYVDYGIPVGGRLDFWVGPPIRGRVVYEVQSQVGQELAKQEKQLRENYGIGIQDVAEDFENWLEGRPLKIKWLADEFLGDDDAAVDKQLPERGLGGLISHSSSDMANADLSDWLTLHRKTWWPDYKEITPQMEKDGYDPSDPGIFNPLEAAQADINNLIMPQRVDTQEGGLYLHRQIKEVLKKHPELQPSFDRQVEKLKEEIKRRATKDPTIYPFKIDGQTIRKHPLIRHTDRLSLQLALAEAREAGHSHLMIVDAETAMQVQGHDKTLVDNLDVAGGKDHKKKGRPRQEDGMRAAYDGKLVDILVKLTGDKGTRVDLGKGQHTSNVVAIGKTDSPRPVFKNPEGTPKDRVTAIAFAIPDALSMGLFSRQPADPRFPNGFKPLAASGAQRNTNKINSNRTVEILELPVFETGPYEGPGGWMPWNWKILKGHLDPRLRRLFELRRQYQRYLGAEIRQYKDTMDALIDEEFGGRENAPLELIRLATGSTQGVVLSEEVEDQINSEYEAAMDIIAESALPKAVKEEATAKAKAKRLDRRRLEEGKAAAIIQKDIDYAKDALREQSPAVADHVESLRNMVDELSEQTSRLLGGPVGNEELKIHFDAQMGIYLTRTYKIFSEEGWMDTVLENPDFDETRKEAINWFENKFLEERAKSIVNSKNRKPSAKWSKLDDEAKYNLALERARDELADQEGLGQELMKEFLRSYQSEPKLTEGQSESRADIVDSLRRKLSDDDLPPVIRKMLGEYAEDTGDFNLMRTFVNVGDLASRQAFLHGIADMGRSGKQEDWWLLTKKEVEARGLQDDYVTLRDMQKVPARENREGITGFDPLIDFVDEKGKRQGPLYAPKDTVENFRAFMEPVDPKLSRNIIIKSTAYLNDLLRKPTGIAMAAMTLGSIPFYLRNIASNVLFFGPAQGVLVDPWIFKKALKEVARVYTTNTERDAARMRMIKLGVLGEDLTVSVWEEMVSGRVSQTQVLSDLQRAITEASKFQTKGLDIPKKLLDKLKQTAVACDAFYKIVLYQHELKYLKKAQDYAIKRDPTDPLADTDLWTEAKLEEEAARKVLMVAQSYSQAPPIVRGFTESAMGNLVAPFFRFKLEVPRIIWNTYKLGFKEAKSNNPIIRRRGRIRVSAMSAMLGPVTSGLGTLSKLFFGITDEEEEALREDAPDWAKTQTYFYFRMPDGTPFTVNMTYVNPFAMWVDGPLRFAESMFRGDPNEGMKLGLEALWGTPFTEGQIFIKGFTNAYISNEDDYGGDIALESDNVLEAGFKKATYLTSKVFQPPTLKRLFGEFRPGARRPLIAAIEENRKVKGVESFLRHPAGIAFTEFLIAKPRTLDSQTIFNNNMDKAKRKKSSADSALNKLKAKNQLSKSQIQGIAENYVEAVEGYATIAMSYGGAYKKWGISDKVIRAEREQILTKAGYKKFLKDGVIKLRGLSKQDITQMKEAADEHDLPQIEERIRLFEQALENRSDKDHKGYIRLPGSFAPKIRQR